MSDSKIYGASGVLPEILPTRISTSGTPVLHVTPDILIKVGTAYPNFLKGKDLSRNQQVLGNFAEASYARHRFIQDKQHEGQDMPLSEQDLAALYATAATDDASEEAQLAAAKLNSVHDVLFEKVKDSPMDEIELAARTHELHEVLFLPPGADAPATNLESKAGNLLRFIKALENDVPDCAFPEEIKEHEVRPDLLASLARRLGEKLTQMRKKWDAIGVEAPSVEDQYAALQLAAAATRVNGLIEAAALRPT